MISVFIPLFANSYYTDLFYKEKTEVPNTKQLARDNHLSLNLPNIWHEKYVTQIDTKIITPKKKKKRRFWHQGECSKRCEPRRESRTGDSQRVSEDQI